MPLCKGLNATEEYPWLQGMWLSLQGKGLVTTGATALQGEPYEQV